MTREYNATLAVTSGSRDAIGAVVGQTSSILILAVSFVVFRSLAGTS
jgi:hypothetical protein